MNYDYCDGMIYTVKKGDTLYSISRSKQVPLSMLLRANPYVDVYNLQVGDTICIPMKRKPCKGMHGSVLQENQDMADNNEIAENIITAKVKDEALSDATSMADIMEANEADEAAALKTVPNRMENNDNINDRNTTANRQNMNETEMSGGSFTRYVTQPGDTLADVIARSDADQNVFWEKNAMDRIHLLPGISYLVFEETE